MWSLSQDWYGDRLDAEYFPRTPEATQRLLLGVGLTSAFWQLHP